MSVQCAECGVSTDCKACEAGECKQHQCEHGCGFFCPNDILEHRRAKRVCNGCHESKCHAHFTAAPFDRSCYLCTKSTVRELLPEVAKLLKSVSKKLSAKDA